MKNLLLLFFLTFSISFFSQELLMDFEVVTAADAFAPKFNGGGVEKFYDFIKQEFDLSKLTKPGTIKTSFIVDVNGQLKNVKIIQFPNIEAASEMIRVINKSPDWQPAMRAGKPFSTVVEIPLKYSFKQTLTQMIAAPKSTNEKVVGNEVVSAKQNSPAENSIYNSAGIEVAPKFPSGMSEFYKFIGANYNVPNVKGLAGKVFIQFVIEKDGSVTDIKVLEDIGHRTGEEAIRVLKLSPRWLAGEQNGKKVRCTYQLPISITASN